MASLPLELLLFYSYMVIFTTRWTVANGMAISPMPFSLPAGRCYGIHASIIRSL